MPNETEINFYFNLYEIFHKLYHIQLDINEDFEKVKELYKISDELLRNDPDTALDKIKEERYLKMMYNQLEVISTSINDYQKGIKIILDKLESEEN